MNLVNSGNDCLWPEAAITQLAYFGSRMKKFFKPRLILIALLACVGACKEPIPDFVQEMIDSPPMGEVVEVWRYRFKGETVYYFPPLPYDIPSVLINAKGETICSPDGGLAGSGDGKCPAFFSERRGGRLVWKVGQEAP